VLNSFSDAGLLWWSWGFEPRSGNVKRSKEEKVMGFTAISAAAITAVAIKAGSGFLKRSYN
jgi:hypothetical protein